VSGSLLLEVPARWIVRPDIPDMVPGNPWFRLPVRLAVEVGLIMGVLALARVCGASSLSVGVPRRAWTRWEWAMFGLVAIIELAVVILAVGHRWPRLAAAGLLGKALPWAASEFLFGFNQELGFRGGMMSGLLRLTSPLSAALLNTLVFLAGPLHGPGLIGLALRQPGAAVGLLLGVVATGLFFSWLRYRSDNVVLCGVLHGIVNGFMNGAAFARRAYL
jgi:membrane protease YdiL (CAAX protease family)